MNAEEQEFLARMLVSAAALLRQAEGYQHNVRSSVSEGARDRARMLCESLTSMLIGEKP